MFKRNRLYKLVLTLAIASVIVSGCSSPKKEGVATSKPEVPTVSTEVTEPVEETSTASFDEITPEAAPIETQQEIQPPVAETKVLSLMKVHFYGSKYASGLEILELGDVVEDCQSISVEFLLAGEDIVNESLEIDYVLSSSQYRALRDAFVSEGLSSSDDPDDIWYNSIRLANLGYKMEISSVESENSPLYKIISPLGAVIWDSNMKVAPRQLNDVELAYLKLELNRSYNPNYTIGDMLDPSVGWYEGDIEKACEDVWRDEGGNLLSTFSPIEVRARKLAFLSYMIKNTEVFLIYDWSPNEYGKLIISDTSGVLTPFASDDGSRFFFRTKDNFVTIEFSENKDVAYTFNPRIFGVVILDYTETDYYEGKGDEIVPDFRFLGRADEAALRRIEMEDENHDLSWEFVATSPLVLTDSDVVDILNSKMSEN